MYVADLRLFRKDGKRGNYNLNGFEGQKYEYVIKNVALTDIEQGYRTIVPISFIKDDRFYIGVHRDKLLSNPKIIHDKNSKISFCINDLWDLVSQNLVDESIRIYGSLDLQKLNILNALEKSEKMSEDVKTAIRDKMEFFISKFYS